jgi:hypothetical protein
MSGMLDDTARLLTEAASPADGVEAMLSALDRYSGSDPTSLLFVEAYLAANRDAQLRERIRDIVQGFRTALTTSLASAGHPYPDGAASVIAAVLDGFILHKGLDPELSAARIAPVLRAVAGDEPAAAAEPNGAQP